MQIGKKLRALQRGSEKEVIAKEKDTLKRAKAYEKQARKYPNDPDVDTLHNAAVDYLKAGAIAPALAAYLVIVKKFPKTDQAKDSLIQVALINEKYLVLLKRVISIRCMLRNTLKISKHLVLFQMHVSLS